MNSILIKFYVKFQDLISREEGQDLVEYALITALIALVAVVSVKTVAAALTTQFTAISTAVA